MSSIPPRRPRAEDSIAELTALLRRAFARLVAGGHDAWPPRHPAETALLAARRELS